jgi:hypothetical protein
MNISVSTAGTVRDHQCIVCLKCTSEQSCPVDRTVELRVGAADAGAVAGRMAATPDMAATSDQQGG